MQDDMSIQLIDFMRLAPKRDETVEVKVGSSGLTMVEIRSKDPI